MVSANGGQDFNSSGELARYVAECAASGQQLAIQGSGSKAFYGNPAAGSALSLSGISGISDYAASELYITARAATKLADISAALAEHGQMLPFDPPQYGSGGSFGGAIAAGLAGTGKPRYGGVRDAVLGVQLINGKGELLTFGGQVMKNVAGYDVSRLMVGALGTLGVITEATVKVLPRSALSCTVVQTLPPPEAVAALRQYIQRCLPLAASFYQEGRLYMRLVGGSVDWAVAALPAGQRLDDEADLWRQLRDHALPFFNQPDKPLWRISVPPTQQAAQAYSSGLASGSRVFEWNGAVYWQVGGDAAAVHQQAQQLGGYACLFRRGSDMEATTPFLPPPSAIHQRLHQRLKQAFDPANILNVGKMYP